MHLIKYIFVVGMVTLMAHPVALLGESADRRSEVVGTITDKEPSWYAIVKINGRRGKLYVEGDIFCSDVNINRCLRIQDIKENTLILRDINLKKTLIVKPGERIPLEGTEMIFEKTVETDIIEYRYKTSKENGKRLLEDFTVKGLEKKKIVLERDFDRAVPGKPHPEERELFSSPRVEDREKERINASFFKKIEVKKIGNSMWSVDKNSTHQAFSNAGRTLVSVIRGVKPRFRFGESPSLRFNCELGNLVLNKNGFLVQNLAVVKLAERAGIKQGDLIKKINGQPVNSLYGIYKAYMEMTSNTDIKVVDVDIIRKGRPERLVYKLQ